MQVLRIVKLRLEQEAAYLARTQETYIGAQRTEPVMPSTTLTVVGGTDDWTHQGATGLNQKLVRIYSRGRNDKECALLAGAVHDALQGWRGVIDDYEVQLIQHRNENSDHDEETGIFRQIDDYRVHYRRLA